LCAAVDDALDDALDDAGRVQPAASYAGGNGVER
jgi:hypothetical protein